MSSLTVTSEGQLCTLTLDRPEAMNALNRELTDCLGAAIEMFSHDDDLRVAVIRGAGGRAFSAGADLKEMSARAGNLVPMPDSIPWYKALLECDKPVIAAVDGYCLAAGFELALMCDIRVATVGSTFGLPEPRRNLLAGPGLHHLWRTVPFGEAMLMQLTGRRITAQRAYDIGLVQEMAADRDELMRRVGGIVDDVLECAPLAVRYIKRVVRGSQDVPVRSAWELSRSYWEQLVGSHDSVEGPKAFVEKRPPRWQGC